MVKGGEERSGLGGGLPWGCSIKEIEGPRRAPTYAGDRENTPPKPPESKTREGLLGKTVERWAEVAGKDMSRAVLQYFQF